MNLIKVRHYKPASADSLQNSGSAATLPIVYAQSVVDEIGHVIAERGDIKGHTWEIEWPHIVEEHESGNTKYHKQVNVYVHCEKDQDACASHIGWT